MKVKMVSQPPSPRIIHHYCLCFALPFFLALKARHNLQAPLDPYGGPAVSKAMNLNDNVSLSPAFLSRYPGYQALEAIRLSEMRAHFASEDLFGH